MASDQRQRCQWNGCLCDSAFGDLFCRKHQGFMSSASLPPTSDKKQLSDKHTARKSVRPIPTIELVSGPSTHSPTRKIPLDSPPVNVRPAKRPRLSALPNGPGLLLKPTDSSLTDNGIPHPSKRGMFRQPEERPHKLSAIDDFALRPKKSEAANELALNDQRPSHQKGSLSNSDRQTPSISKATQPPNPNGLISSGSFVVDLTGDDDPPISNGVEVGPKKRQDIPDGSSDLLRGQGYFAVDKTDDKRLQTPPTQVRGASQGPKDAEQDLTNSLLQNPPQKVLSDSPAVINTAKPVKRITVTYLNGKPVTPASRVSSKIFQSDPGSFSKQQDLQPTKGRQDSDGVRQSPALLDTRRSSSSSTSVNSIANYWKVQRKTVMKPVRQTVEAVSTPAVQQRTPTPKRSTPAAELPPPITQPPPVLQSVETPSVDIDIKRPLTALLGGRKWKDMSPEDRRLFWVSQHDPKKLDEQIYGELNRPFRPGEAAYKKGYSALIPRPTRKPTHFGYIDQKTYAQKPQTEEWYQRKQEEISARSNRKANFGKAIERLAQRKRTESKRTAKQVRDSLPKRVRDNPKWLAALDVIEQIQAQNRARTRVKREYSAVVNDSVDSDVDMESV